jgi:hypothetical protein
MHFSARIAVRLEPCEGLVSADRILVSLQFYYRGQAYYATILGLTDAHGTAERTFEALERDFRYDQKLFPMDFRVPLGDCDRHIEVQVEGDGDFVKRLNSVASNPFVTPDVRGLYENAQNEQVKSTRKSVDLPGISPDLLVIDLPVAAANQGR